MLEQVTDKSWFARLREGLGKSTNKISTGLTNIFTKRKLDKVSLEELEELLIEADLGVETAAVVIRELANNYFDKEVSPAEIRESLSAILSNMLQAVESRLLIDSQLSPQVILVCGVNGNGKTTTIGKIAAYYKAQGKKVAIAACDTFRAAAVEQLEVWAERSGCRMIKGELGADPASVAYMAVEQAKKLKDDILLIDTAGRLHNKTNLMEELAKIIRVIRKLDEQAPHNILLVLDATTGQNANSQVELFNQIVKITGLVITKLDGTAKAGVVVNLAKKYGIAIHFIGVGEAIEDLYEFEAKLFASNLVGLHDF